MLKLIIPIIVIAGVIGGWFMWTNQPTSSVAPIAEKVTPKPAEPVPAPVPQVPDTGITSTATSDADLTTDLATIDAHIQTATAGSAAIDQALTDKPLQ